ncbi:hypothetical protein [Emticicia fluvialis]|uniref:hypothetical protein n=1 Tax=Emticicia fluvialis TaxID=2974474 RepID=UPI002165B943|nr:hypothetical protein [Emticicia fluvialis]
MKKFLLDDNVPYLFTILIGLAAYQLNNVVTIQIESPILAFSFKTIEENKVNSTIVERAIECEIENINYKKAFRSLEIVIAFRTILQEPHKVYNPTIVPISPSMIISGTNSINIDEDRNKYIIPVLQPNAKYILKLTTKQNISIKEYPKLYINSSDDVRLIETDLLVVLIKNQILINIILFVIWFILIIIYFQILKSNKT